MLALAACGAEGEPRDTYNPDEGWNPGVDGVPVTQCEIVYMCLIDHCTDAWEWAESHPQAEYAVEAWEECRDECWAESPDLFARLPAEDAFLECMETGDCSGCED
jgi:hypothetical protein